MSVHTNVTADPSRGTAIGSLYAAAPEYDREAEQAYTAFRDETVRQFNELSRWLSYSVSDTDPYGDYQAMRSAVDGGSLAVLSTASTGGHPFLTDAENDIFRYVHDFHGHYSTGRDFSRHGEEAAWMRHSAMYSPLARRAMTTETRGQNSAFIWLLGGRQFPQQKITILPEWVSQSCS